MTTIKLQAEMRNEVGKGASRRFRRENKIPAVIYGGSTKPSTIFLLHNKMLKALENENIYSTVFDLEIDNKVEHVLLKDLQRHPYKPIIMHVDLQRVSAKDVIIKSIPIHFLNESSSAGVKAGGLITHNLTQIELKCQVKDLPEFIAVDMLNVNLDQVVHLTDLKLPKGVELTIDLTDPSRNLPIVSIHAPKKLLVTEEENEPLATNLTTDTKS